MGEFCQVVAQDLSTFLSEGPACMGLHGFGQTQEFFMEMVDGVGAVIEWSVGGEGVITVKKGSIERAGDREDPGQTDGAEAFDAIRVLHDLGFERFGSDLGREAMRDDGVLGLRDLVWGEAKLGEDWHRRLCR